MYKLLFAFSVAFALVSCSDKGNAVAPSANSSSSNDVLVSSSSILTSKLIYQNDFTIDPKRDAGAFLFSAYGDSISAKIIIRRDSVYFEGSVPAGAFELEYASSSYVYSSLPNATHTMNTAGLLKIETTFPKDSTDTIVNFRLRSTDALHSYQYELHIPWSTIPAGSPSVTDGGVFLQFASLLNVSPPTVYQASDTMNWSPLNVMANSTSGVFFLMDSGAHQFLTTYTRRNMICDICSGSYTRTTLTGMLTYVAPIIHYSTNNAFRLFTDNTSTLSPTRIGIVTNPILYDTLINVYYSTDSIQWTYYGKSTGPWLQFSVTEDNVPTYVKATIDTAGHHFESDVVKVTASITGIYCKSLGADSITVQWSDHHWDSTIVYQGTNKDQLSAVDTLLPLPEPTSHWDYNRSIIRPRLGGNVANFVQTEHWFANQPHHKSSIYFIDTL